MPILSEDCYLKLNPKVAYRNMLMLPKGDGKIHFEFPVFEDHSYNTICNRNGMRAIIEKDPDSDNERYMLFQTFDEKLKKKFIIGYYRIGKRFYYETKKWDNYGYVWGIESDEVHLLSKDALQYNGPSISPGYRSSWSKSKKNINWNEIIEHYFREIQSRENIKDLYQSETIRIIKLFKDPEKIKAWRNQCETCIEKCEFFRKNLQFKKNHENDLLSVIHLAHTSDLYSRNELLKLKKIYLRKGC
jgi:hypothetical protein